MYAIIRDVLFKFPPENVHHFSMKTLQSFCAVPFGKKILAKQFSYNDTALQKKIWNLTFNNPIGIAAGFDKNAFYLNELEALGFGFVEIGSVTPLAQNGNDKPRLFRLPKDKALINRMAFNNDGVKPIKQRLAKWKAKKSTLIVGGNIGKNKITTNEDAWKDYEICFTELFDVVDYFVVNVSSPNTPNLRALQDKDSLRKIFGQLQNINQGKQQTKPLLLKIAPDLSTEQLDDIIELAEEIKLHGIVATNTTISRENLITPAKTIENIGLGGLSGKPVKPKSTAVVQYLSNHLNKNIAIIASGGIFNADDAKEKLNAGASLLQVYTGFIYQGPSIVKNICKGLR